ncbi:MAG: toll/interleukin-1 receptor domain-containing protein [Oryzomonas sp.]|jgi:hypothetical protein
MGMIEELEKLGEVEVLRGMANGLHGQPGSPLRSQVEAWLRLKEFERNHSNSSSKNGTEPLVFISYDNHDIDLVIALDGIIKRIFEDKIKTFVAKRDIKAGEDAFKKMLHDSLAKCSIVLAICTKRSLTSPWLWFESGAGFGSSSSALIPIWAGITPEEFKAPMTIFQGKNIVVKTEVQDVMTRISDKTKLKCDSFELTDSEFNNLLDINNELKKIGNPKQEKQTNLPYEIKYITINKLKWQVKVFHENYHEVDEKPYCVKHDLKFIDDDDKVCCPMCKSFKCNNKIHHHEFVDIYNIAKSLIDRDLRSNSK